MPPMRSAGTVTGTPYTAESQLNDLIYGPSDYAPPLAYDPMLEDTQGQQAQPAPLAPSGYAPTPAPAAAPAPAPAEAPYGPPADQGYQAQTQTAPTSAPAPATSESYVTNAPQEAPQPAPGSSYNMVDAARAVSPMAPPPTPAPPPGPGSSYNMVTAAQSVSPPIRGGGSQAGGVPPNVDRASGLVTLEDGLRSTGYTLSSPHMGAIQGSRASNYPGQSGTWERGVDTAGSNYQPAPPPAASPTEEWYVPETRPLPRDQHVGMQTASGQFADPRAQQQTDQQRLDDLLNTPAEGDAALFDNLGSALGTMRDNLGRTSGTYQAAQMLPDVGQIADWAKPPGGLGPSQAVRDVLDWANPPGGLGPSQAVRDTVGTIAANGAAGLGAISDLMPFQPAQPEPFGTTQQFRNARSAREQVGTNVISDWPVTDNGSINPQDARGGGQQALTQKEVAQKTQQALTTFPSYAVSLDETGAPVITPLEPGSDASQVAQRGQNIFTTFDSEGHMINTALATDTRAALEANGVRFATLDDTEFQSLVDAGKIPADLADQWHPWLVNGNAIVVPEDWMPFIQEGPVAGAEPQTRQDERAARRSARGTEAASVGGAAPASDVGVTTTPTGDVVFTPAADTAATPSGGVASDVYGGGGSGSGGSSGGSYRTSYGGGGGGSDSGYAPSAMPPGFMEGFRWNDMLPSSAGSRSSRSRRGRRMRTGRRGSAPSTTSFGNFGAGVPRNPAEEMNLQRLFDLQGRR